MGKYTFKKNKIRLPDLLVHEIESLNLKITDKSHAIKFISLLINHSFQETGDIFSYTSKSKSYLKKTFSATYNNWLQVLLENQIVLRTHYYKNNLSYYYSLNPSYNTLFNNPSILWVKTFSNQFICREYKEKIFHINNVEKEYFKWFSEDMDFLKVDFTKLNEIVENRVNNLTIDSLGYCTENNNLKSSNKVISIGNKYYCNCYMKSEKLLEISNDRNYSIIQSPEGCYLDDLEHFLNKKKLSIYLSYMNSLDSIREKRYRVDRNEKNYRLDTNLTNLYSELTEEICRQNDLVQIDLSNSQFCFLSDLLKNNLKTHDSFLFRTLSYNGSLYVYVKKKLSLKSYKECKKMMFSLLFSSEKNTTKEKSQLKKIFPTVVKWVDNFKKENGYKSFSIELQKMESNFFIDNILKTIKNKKLFCLTKHDSLIIRREDYNKVIEIIRKISNDFGFGGLYKSDFNREYKKIELVGLNLSFQPFKSKSQTNFTIISSSGSEIVEKS
jgi:hypothetical protein